MNRQSPWLARCLGILTLSLLSGGSALAQQGPRTVVTSGYLEVSNEHKARLVLSNPTARDEYQDRELQAEILIRDAQGRVIARRTGLLTSKQPLIVEVAKATASATPMLVHAEAVFPANDTIGIQSCPLNLTLQITSNKLAGSGAALGCGVDPCCDTCGPGHASGVAASCTTLGFTQ